VNLIDFNHRPVLLTGEENARDVLDGLDVRRGQLRRFRR
jgi:hypothetical protein